MTQQCQNKNLTKDDTNKVQKNVGMTQQCQNKNLTKVDTNKVLFLHVYTYVYTMFTPMFKPCLHQCLHHVHTYVYTMFTFMFTNVRPMFSPYVPNLSSLCALCVLQLRLMCVVPTFKMCQSVFYSQREYRKLHIQTIYIYVFSTMPLHSKAVFSDPQCLKKKKRTNPF